MNLFANKLVYKIEIDSQAQETNLGLPKGLGEGINQEFEISIYTTTYEIDEQQDLLYSTGNYDKYFILPYKGKETEKIDIYIYISSVQSLSRVRFFATP